MSSIRERSPSEIYLEKKLLNYQSSNSESSGLLFNFFKSKAKEMITYHLDKPKKPRRISKENYPEDSEDYTPPKSFSRSKPRPKKARESLDVEPSDDYKRLREIISKRAYVIENVTGSINSQKKVLNTIKVTTNREQLVRQVSEVEESNDQVVEELETLLLSFHDSLRQIDKLAQISAFEKSNLTKELNIDFQESLNKERKKYEAQIKALQDLNRSLSALPKAVDVEREYTKKITEIQNKLDFHQESLEGKSDSLRKKQAELSELLRTVSEKNNEIEKGEEENDRLQALIKSQEENFERENSVLRSDIAKLERILKENASNQEQSIAAELQAAHQSIQHKEREISRLKLDLENIEEQMRRQHFEIDTKQRNIFELREEIQKLQDHKKVSSKNESQEIAYLRQGLEEKERQLAMERDRVSIEIETREKHRIKQKNEWAEIYTGLKHEIKELKQTIMDLTEERERRGLHSSIRDSEVSESQITLKTQIETLKLKLKVRDNELKSLWEIISELQRADSSKGRLDFNDVRTLIIIKNLEEKAKQRLKKFL